MRKRDRLAASGALLGSIHLLFSDNALLCRASRFHLLDHLRTERFCARLAGVSNTEVLEAAYLSIASASS